MSLLVWMVTYLWGTFATPDSPTPTRGMLRERLGLSAEAAADFDAAVALEPTSAAFVRNRGLCHSACGEMEAAIACFTRALQLAPNEPATLASRGYGPLIYVPAAHRPHNLHVPGYTMARVECGAC